MSGYSLKKLGRSGLKQFAIYFRVNDHAATTTTDQARLGAGIIQARLGEARCYWAFTKAVLACRACRPLPQGSIKNTGVLSC